MWHRRGDAEGRRAARAGVGGDGDSPHAIRRDGSARCIAHLVGGLGLGSGSGLTLGPALSLGLGSGTHREGSARVKREVPRAGGVGEGIAEVDGDVEGGRGGHLGGDNQPIKRSDTVGREGAPPHAAQPATLCDPACNPM
eukprot:scaffold66078_cov54-Phaeocystis_antarctica.AAC.2